MQFLQLLFASNKLKFGDFKKKKKKKKPAVTPSEAELLLEAQAGITFFSSHTQFLPIVGEFDDGRIYDTSLKKINFLSVIQ